MNFGSHVCAVLKIGIAYVMESVDFRSAFSDRSQRPVYFRASVALSAVSIAGLI